MKEIGVETGGSNIQFAVNPENGELMVIEMNPRVSRSSALASKATGFPIAKIAAKLAVGYFLDEIANDITRETPASFEPAIDYVVVKMPRFTFEKFPGTEDVLGTQMKSIGEVMAIGRNFKEALQKAIRSLETGRYGLGADGQGEINLEILKEKIATPNSERLFYLKEALKKGYSIEEVYKISYIDPWFLSQIKEIIELEEELKKFTLETVSADKLLEAKKFGFSDYQLAFLFNSREEKVREKRKKLGIKPVYKMVDTCAAEFEAFTPYFYSTYEQENEALPSSKPKVIIFGSGPNRIGQGIEFDYACVHAAFALKEEGYETIMVNCNPETVSTDYDTSDRLYFEPLTLEDVLHIIENEKPLGVITQFGGQTPLKLAVPLEKAGVKILGTSSESIDIAEDRKRFNKLLRSLKIKQPPGDVATSYQEALEIAERIGYPLLVRPSYVLGGRAMEIVYSADKLEEYITSAVKASPEHPVLIDRFLEDAIEIDVDALCDSKDVFVGGIMEHIEEAGVHSGDSSCVLPPITLSESIIREIEEITQKIALTLKVKGLINIQMALKDGELFVLEVNPRASRTVPFVSKAIGFPLAKAAAKLAIGKELKDFKLPSRKLKHIAVKEVALPFRRFPGADTVLGPEMKSTGEVMGIDTSFPLAFAKAQAATGSNLPLNGKIFISVADRDKKNIVPIARELKKIGFDIVSTKGTYQFLKQAGIEVEEVKKVREGRPNIIDLIKDGSISLIINTPWGKETRSDGYYIRTTAAFYGLPSITTIPGAKAAVEGIKALKKEKITVKSLQEYHREIEK